MSTEMAEAEYSGAMAATLIQEPTPAYVLKVSDRCDRCKAQAFFLVSHEDWPQDLLFCGHHGKANLQKFMDLDCWIIDETDRLDVEAGLMKKATTEV
jgi:hypothetical protein